MKEVSSKRRIFRGIYPIVMSNGQLIALSGSNELITMTTHSTIDIGLQTKLISGRSIDQIECIGIGSISILGDQILSKDVRLHISKWLTELRLASEITKLPCLCLGVFERVFTKKHFSFSCFVRSCISSALWMILLLALFFLADAERYQLGSNYVTFSSLCAGFFFLGVSINLIPDYFSLLETRFLLSLVYLKFQESEAELSFLLPTLQLYRQSFSA